MKASTRRVTRKRPVKRRTVRRTVRRKKTSPGKVILVVALAVVVVVGVVLLVRALGGGGLGGGLSGTWVSDINTESNGLFGKMEMKFTSGNWEAKIDGTPIMKGTYTTNGNTYTETTTHMHGAIYKEAAGSMFGIESKWYTRAQLKATPFGGMMPESSLDQIFGTQTGTYSIVGNKLTMPGNDGKAFTLTRK